MFWRINPRNKSMLWRINPRNKSVLWSPEPPELSAGQEEQSPVAKGKILNHRRKHFSRLLVLAVPQFLIAQQGWKIQECMASSRSRTNSQDQPKTLTQCAARSAFTHFHSHPVWRPSACCRVTATIPSSYCHHLHWRKTHPDPLTQKLPRTNSLFFSRPCEGEQP